MTRRIVFVRANDDKKVQKLLKELGELTNLREWVFRRGGGDPPKAFVSRASVALMFAAIFNDAPDASYYAISIGIVAVYFDSLPKLSKLVELMKSKKLGDD